MQEGEAGADWGPWEPGGAESPSLWATGSCPRSGCSRKVLGSGATWQWVDKVVRAPLPGSSTGK